MRGGYARVVSDELAEYLRYLLDRFERLADRVPTPAEPPDSAAERAADEWWHRYQRHEMEWEEPSPEVATAMLPRVWYALLIGSRIESELQTQEEYKDAEKRFDALLEQLLEAAWHRKGRDSWLRGEWGW